MSYYVQSELDAMFVRQVCFRHNLDLERGALPDTSVYQWIDTQYFDWMDSINAHWEYWAPIRPQPKGCTDGN